MSKNISLLSGRKGLANNLFEQITELPVENRSEAITARAKEFLLGEAVVYGSDSFYDFTQGDNANKKAYVCNGSSCLCADTQPQLYSKLKQQLDEDEIGHVCCLGRCHENSAFQINGNNYSGDDYLDSETLLKQLQPSKEKLPVSSNMPTPILTTSPENISDYYQLLCTLTKNLNPVEIVNKITGSGLRGRGGAGFPTGIKWQACMDASSDEKFIVCNADEGDPGAFTDRYLLEQNPHSILFGMLTAAWLCKANYGVLYIRDEYPESIVACEQAIAALSQLKLSIFEDWDFTFKIIRGAGAYICGEETALLNSIEGQRPIVSVRPPFPTEQGLFAKPTILNNVETFSCIHFILDDGEKEFKKLGTEKSSGCKLLSLDSCFNNPGVYEVAMGTSLDTVVNDLGGGFCKPIKALHIGGPLGGLVPLSKIADLSIDFETFQSQGFLLGHGSIIGIPESMPMIEYVQHLFEFTAEESCGKCFPCRLGATRGHEMFGDAIHKKQLLNKELLLDLLETMEEGSLCALGGGVPLPVRNALQWFADELAPWFDKTKQQPYGERIL